MKSWLIRVLLKTKLGVVREEVIDAPTAEVAANLIEGGPVRFFYKGKDHWEFVGQGYLYEVRKL